VICVTGSESTVDQLAARIEAHRRFPLQEVRLDLLDSIDDSVFDLLHDEHLVVTCRDKSEGGHFPGSDSERHQILSRALEQQPAYLDLEASAPVELRQDLFAKRGHTRLILSWHCFEGFAQLPAKLDSEPADLLKVAVQIEDAADLVPLQQLLSDSSRQVIRIGMGQAGLLSRALYDRFGSPWTYVVPDDTPVVAPGQLGVSTAEAWRIADQANLTPLGLLGGPSVLESPGPRVYNRLFAVSELPFIYLPVVTAQPEQTLDLLERLGFGGLSVTMPAKEILAGQMSETLAPAGRLGAINTVILRDRKRIGLNTDVPAISRLLAHCGGKPALVLGAGGAARAAVTALLDLACPVTVTSRNPARAKGMANYLSCSCVPWEARDQQPFDLLVNATPCEDPMPRYISWRGKTVLDAVISREPTPLLQRVQDGGGEAIDGKQWWIEQGALQMEALTGHDLSLAAMKEALDA
jgi:3-dehydroquinate dehydratase/shikimate dehydrogenase